MSLKKFHLLKYGYGAGDGIACGARGTVAGIGTPEADLCARCMRIAVAADREARMQRERGEDVGAE